MSDNTENFYLPLATDKWRLVTDGVMGGVSRGETGMIEADGKSCIELKGNVSTENNGGFIQVAMDIDKQQAKMASQHAGITLEVKGNSEKYNLHMRTSDLWFPWQAYRATFEAGPEWQTVRLPFELFQPYKTGTALNLAHLKRIGIVAIGREFDADICIANVGFYPDQE